MRRVATTSLLDAVQRIGLQPGERFQYLLPLARQRLQYLIDLEHLGRLRQNPPLRIGKSEPTMVARHQGFEL